MKEIIDNNSKGYGGRTPWRAPEIKDGESAKELKSDVYSYGIILWELITKQLPYIDWVDMKSLFKAIRENNLRPEIPATCSPLFADLIRSCWDADVDKRPTFQQIIDTLKPYEHRLIALSKQLYPRGSSYSEIYQSLSATQLACYLLSLRPSQSISIVFSSVCKLNFENSITREISELSQKISNDSQGNLLLFNYTYNKFLFIVSFNDRETIMKTDCIKDVANCLFSMCTDYLVIPMHKQIKLLLKYSLKPNPKFAIGIQFQLRTEFNQQSLELYENFVIPTVHNSSPSWCGSMLLVEVENFASQTLYIIFAILLKLRVLGFYECDYSCFLL